LIINYNTRPHDSLNGRAPADINSRNESIVWKEQYIDTIKLPKSFKAKSFKYKVGDLVRISHLKRIFQRDYSQKFSEEVFIIKSRHFRGGIPIYIITDYDGDPITGTFYENEFQRVNKNKEDLWRVDKIIKKRGKGRTQELFVSFLGFPKKFNTWVKKTDVFEYK